MTHRIVKAALAVGVGLPFICCLASAQTVPAGRREATGSAYAAKREIVLLECPVSSTDPIKLPAREAGSIMNIAVKRGTHVKAGDLIGQVDDTDAVTKKEIAERERDAAQVKAESEFELVAAQQGEQVAKENYDANVDLNKKGGAVSLFELRRSKFEYQRATAQI